MPAVELVLRGGVYVIHCVGLAASGKGFPGAWVRERILAPGG